VKLKEEEKSRFVFINRVAFLNCTYYWVHFIVDNVKIFHKTETTIELQKELECEDSKDYEIIFYYEFHLFAVSIKFIVAQSIIIC
jgi:hypothetical protein